MFGGLHRVARYIEWIFLVLFIALFVAYLGQILFGWLDLYRARLTLALFSLVGTYGVFYGLQRKVWLVGLAGLTILLGLFVPMPYDVQFVLLTLGSITILIVLLFGKRSKK